MAGARSVEAIIERQVRAWEARERIAREGGRAARAAMAHLKEGPWISVSRQLGSAGDEVVEVLRGRLGWEAYDRSILRGIAEQTQTRQAVLSRLDGHAVVAFNDYLAQILSPDLPGQATFLREMIQVIWGLARRGQAIIVGRGANWFLNREFGLRVRFVAPLEARARRVASQLGVSLAQAERKVIEYDDERAAFMRQAFKHEINDPQGYDLVLNTGTIDTSIAADIVVRAIRARFENAA